MTLKLTWFSLQHFFFADCFYAHAAKTWRYGNVALLGLRSNVPLIDLHFTSLLTKHSVDIVNRIITYGFGTPFWVSAPQLALPRVWIKLPLEVKPWFLMVSFWKYGMLSNARFCFFIEQLEKRKIKLIRRHIKSEREDYKIITSLTKKVIPWSVRIANRQMWQVWRKVKARAFVYLFTTVEGIASKCLLFFFGTFFIKFQKKRRWKILPRVLFGFGDSIYNEGVRFNVPVIAPLINSSGDKPFVIPSNDTLLSTTLFFTGLFKNIYYKAFLSLRIAYMERWQQKLRSNQLTLGGAANLLMHLKLINKSVVMYSK